jgi:hypothetical protein
MDCRWSRPHEGKLSDYFGGESPPCALDIGNPCRYDGDFKEGYLWLKLVRNQENLLHLMNNLTNRFE